jgi:hypothetical protein
MTDTHVVSALKEKRARLAGELQEAQWLVIALRAGLASVDQTLKLFAEGIDREAIPAKATTGKNPAGLAKGAASRTARDILR